MEYSNRLCDFAITISLPSNHRLNKFLYKDNGGKKNHKQYISELEVSEQDLYLISLFTSPLIARDIKFNYVCETHPNITLGNGKEKRHLHGTIKNITYETKDELKKLYLKSYIKSSSEHYCHMVPIISSGWATYCEKHQLNPHYLADILQHLESDYLPDYYCFGCLKKYF